MAHAATRRGEALLAFAQQQSPQSMVLRSLSRVIPYKCPLYRFLVRGRSIRGWRYVDHGRDFEASDRPSASSPQ